MSTSVRVVRENLGKGRGVAWSGPVHELSMTQGVLESVLRHARACGAQRVTCAHVVFGELSGISPDCVLFFWDALARGTIAEGARLEFRRVAMELTCGECARAFAPGGAEYTCPGCGSTRVRPTRGDECYLEAIDVEGVGEGGGGPSDASRS